MSNKAIFLDRDDTLIDDPGYINDPDQLRLLDDVPQALVELRAMGYKLIVVSNQSAVARGIVTEQVLSQIHERLKQLLAQHGAHLDRIYYCPYHTEGIIEKYRKESDWRKPNPGMLLAASEEMDIDLARSWMIGDGNRDVQAGVQAGCKTILLDNSTHTQRPQAGDPRPDYRAVNMREAVNIIKQSNRSATQTGKQVQPVAEVKDQQETETMQQVETPEIKQQQQPASDTISNTGTEELLKGILNQLKATQRDNMFGEFSAMRMIAGILQIIVPFCLLISVWLMMSPTRKDSSVLIAIGFAAVLQMMALTFYIMQGRK